VIRWIMYKNRRVIFVAGFLNVFVFLLSVSASCLVAKFRLNDGSIVKYDMSKFDQTSAAFLSKNGISDKDIQMAVDTNRIFEEKLQGIQNENKRLKSELENLKKSPYIKMMDFVGKHAFKIAVCALAIIALIVIYKMCKAGKLNAFIQWIKQNKGDGLMNSKQKLVLAIGIALFLFAGLFPPWIGRREPPYKRVGFHFIFSKSGIVDDYNIAFCTVDKSTLYIEWVLVSVLAVGGVLLLSDKAGKRKSD
jgi:hypothetical protein